LNNSAGGNKYEVSLSYGLFAAFISVTIHGILAMTFHLTILPAFFWVIIGLIVSLGNIIDINGNTARYKIKPGQIIIMAIVIICISIYFLIGRVIAAKQYDFAIKKLNEGKPGESITAINKVKIFTILDPRFYELYAQAKAAQGLADEAIQSYRNALSLKRDFAFYHTQIGQLYKQKKMYSAALFEFEEAINLDKYGVCYQEHYSDLGGLYKDLGNKEAAILQFKSALMIQPELTCSVDWAGRDYLKEILAQAQQDYLTLKRKDLLAAEQILFNLNRAGQCKKLQP
jgi:tetratricopeptide (TPR) repeat protein